MSSIPTEVAINKTKKVNSFHGILVNTGSFSSSGSQQLVSVRVESILTQVKAEAG